jgi:hypothetical protein
VSGLIARMGVFAPGPYLRVNDERTPSTYEMCSFRDTLNQLASEAELRRTASPEVVLSALRSFRDGPLAEARREEGLAADAPVLLKHGLAAMLLPELCEVFDVRLVGVVRRLEAIEATRVRRRWPPSFGAQGAGTIYQHLFGYLVHFDPPAEIVSYRAMLERPGVVVDRIADAFGIDVSARSRAAAIDFVSR